VGGRGLQKGPGGRAEVPGYRGRGGGADGWEEGAPHGDDWRRRVASRIANRVRNRLSDETIQDSGCTFRAFRRECLRDLVLYRGLHRFIPTLLRLQGYRVIEVEVNPRPRRFRRSKYGAWSRAFVALPD